jgi:hypothetical protein
MRYLVQSTLYGSKVRRFNESKDELKDYCETNLAYLMDEGFGTWWTRIYNDKEPDSQNETWLISIRKPIDQYNYEIFRWGDVKDQIVRFAYLIDKNYDILPFAVRFTDVEKKFRVLLPKEVRPGGVITPTRDFALQELEDLDDEFLLSSFSLKVVDKI